MCGFVGGVFRRPVTPRDAEAFRAAAGCIAHRGPDAEAVKVVESANAILGFRRLAIIDLATGDQPMDLDGRHHIIFNGEIYNYQDVREKLLAAGVRFKTKSDTEVLLNQLARHGVDGLEPLRGMFGFAYLDLERNRLLLGRDRLGIKQHYVAETPDGVFFSSEPKALLALPWVKASLNAAMLPSYFTFRCVPAPQTLFDGIIKLPPGTVREYNLATFTASETRYWKLPQRGERPMIPASEAVDRFEEAFLTSVKRRLVSDVPVGAFLSGGLDSSLVVAAMHRLGQPNLQTFSATFPGSPDDEGSFAARVSERYDARNWQYPVQPGDFLAALPFWVELNDDLVADASSLPLLYVSRLARQKGCIVMLSGEGADELFGGYGSYHKFVLLHTLGAVLPLAPARRGLVAALTAAGLVSRQNLPRVAEYFVHRRGYMGTAAILGNDEIARLLPDADHAAALSLPRAAGARLSDLGAFDFAHRIPDDLLVRTDRATMGASIEARVPFLDHDLVELAVSLPARSRSMPGVSKVTLRKLALRWGVPRQTVVHRKIGFQLPIGAWFRGPLRGTWDRVLERRAVPGVAYDVVRDIVDAHLSRRTRFDDLLWRVLALEAWHARWIEREPLSVLGFPGEAVSVPSAA